MTKRLVIVTGANGALGNCYLDYYIQQPNTTCVALSRAPMATAAQHRSVDLLDADATAHAIHSIDLCEYQDVVLIHGVGRFKFETMSAFCARSDSNRENVTAFDDEIDQEVLSSNYHTFLHLANPLLAKLEQLQAQNCHPTLALCGFGSVTDKYKIPFWHSYTYAKDLTRTFINELIDSDRLTTRIRGRFINVSTTDTGNENKLRPYATAEEKRYWLKPQKIVDQSVAHIDCLQPAWLEIDVYEPMPDFDRNAYYRNAERIREKWERQMGVIHPEPETV